MRLKRKLSLSFASVVLLTVSLISIFSNILINKEFRKYIIKQQEEKAQQIVTNISAHFYGGERGWDYDSVHAIGVYALHEGYLLRVANAAGEVVWDAKEYDIDTSTNIINEITHRMNKRCYENNCDCVVRFIDNDFPVSFGGKTVGTATISYYGPYFLSENDFDFLSALNIILLSVGVSCLILSAAVGVYMSLRISEPIRNTADGARRMSGGDYNVCIASKNNTKELNDLIGSVNHLAQSLSYQESMRKRLTADVSHELRTPITVVQTHLEAMIKGIWETTPERLSCCYEEVTHMGSLVNDLEGLARVESENVTLDKKIVDLSVILNKAVVSLKRDIENKDISVEMDGYVSEVLADEGRIYQVAVNLLSNAIKYTPQGGHVKISLTQSEDGAGFVIADNGTGIPEEEMPFVFERFYRADKSRNRKTGGSGIGLAVVKAIVMAHGGKVNAESEMGKGSRFAVMLPI